MRSGVTVLLAVLIAFSIGRTATYFEKIEGFKTHKMVSGNLHDFSSESRNGFLGTTRLRFRTTKHWFETSPPNFAYLSFKNFTMWNQDLYLKVASLPEALKKEVIDFIDSISAKKRAQSKPKQKGKTFGYAKDSGVIELGFDAPLDE